MTNPLQTRFQTPYKLGDKPCANCLQTPCTHIPHTPCGFAPAFGGGLQPPIKLSITPLVNPKLLQDVSSSGVPRTGSSGNPVTQVRGRHDLFLVIAPSQGDSGQSTTYNVATLKSKYAIINSILRDQVERR